jgi:DNA-binding NarL/FixJ family response regulator
LSKEIEPDELKQAIQSVVESGFYFNDMMTGRLLAHAKNNNTEGELAERDLNFIRLCCSELTYFEIADKMNLSPKTIDGYRAKLFERFEIKSRVGLVLLAVKKKWLM